MIHTLFLTLGTKYTTKFSSKYPTPELVKAAKAVWARDLGDLLPSQIDFGLDRVIREFPSWPPEVGEFRQLCLVSAEEMGLPTVGQAWAEVSSQRIRQPGEPIYSHGVVFACRQDPSVAPYVYDWSRLPGERGLNKFKPYYDRYLKRAMAGESFELPTVLENKKDIPLTPEEKQQAATRSAEIAEQAFKKLNRVIK